MSCAHHQRAVAGCDPSFTIDASRVTFGRGARLEAGARAAALGMRRVALFTDGRLAQLEPTLAVRRSLVDAGLDVAVYDRVRIEPSDASLDDAVSFARAAKVDGYVSVGGGSVIDTCKIANLLVTHAGELLDWVAAPVGRGRPVPGPLAPHLACPTTSGTGSEVTGIAIFDLAREKLKTGVAARELRPTEALVDPDFTASLPAEVVTASGMDVLCHALESYTARPSSTRPIPPSPLARPMSQGSNRWSDVGCLEALALFGRFFLRAVSDAADDEAREAMMWAATLAGIAFGNAGVHVPHGMSYAVAGLVKSYRHPGYPPEKPLVPHGISVVLSAPSVFRFTAKACPERHLDAARALGADVHDASPSEAGDALAEVLTKWMQSTRVPNGLSAVGYDEAAIPELVARALPQKRLLDNAPIAIDGPTLDALFRGALGYW